MNRIKRFLFKKLFPKKYKKDQELEKRLKELEKENKILRKAKVLPISIARASPTPTKKIDQLIDHGIKVINQKHNQKKEVLPEIITVGLLYAMKYYIKNQQEEKNKFNHIHLN